MSILHPSCDLAGDTDDIWCIVCDSYITFKAMCRYWSRFWSQAIPFPNYTYVGRISTRIGISYEQS